MVAGPSGLFSSSGTIRRALPVTTEMQEVPSLSRIQRRVLEGRANGLSYMQIADEQKYNYQSVKNAGFRVIRKFGATDMAHAVYIAVQLRVLDPARRHGDHAGFAAHRYRKEEPCQACWEGERAYRRERRAARNAAKAVARRPEIRTS